MRKRRIPVVRGTHFKTDSANLIVVPITVGAITVVATVGAITVVVTVVAIMEVAPTIMVAAPTITDDPTGITAGTTEIIDKRLFENVSPIEARPPSRPDPAAISATVLYSTACTNTSI
jgi:hypothetical protein